MALEVLDLELGIVVSWNCSEHEVSFGVTMEEQSSLRKSVIVSMTSVLR